MKKVTLLFILLFIGKLSAQCSAGSPTTSFSVYSLTMVYSPTMGLHVAICCDGVLYDTLVNNSNMFYYIEPGGKLYKKGGVTTMVWIKASGTLINKGGTSAIMAYSEPTATITNIGGPPVNTTTCALVSTPINNCYPLGGGPCGSNGINEMKGLNAQINMNVFNKFLYIENANTGTFKGDIMNSTGQMIMKIDITNGYNTYCLTDLAAGIYFVNVFSKQGKILTKRIIVE